ncbi:T9SS type A sorting domain-containing protein [Pollutibacter soli]|uniref:T9SS type A sorting domain-containing protein n=1 Tax=Pollutibacter soli TaxID=3034157 RepID=UPI0030136D91
MQICIARGQCPGGTLFSPTPIAGTTSANGFVQGTVAAHIQSSGSFASGRPIYVHQNLTYNGFTWRSIQIIRGHSFPASTSTYIKLAQPLSSTYIHFRVSDVRGDAINQNETQRIEGYNNGVPVTPNFEDFVNGAYITGGNIINGASTTTSTVQSAVRIFFSGPVDSVVLTRTAWSDYVIFDMFSRCAILLPFTLSSFEATWKENKSLLSWQVESAWSFNEFIVQRSGDGRDWEDIGKKNIEDNDGFAGHYTYTDRSPLRGRNFYRLKTIDTDGLINYSLVVNLIAGGKSFQKLISKIQNPISSSFQLEITKEATLNIYSAQGSLIYNHRLKTGVHQIPTLNWQPGTYFLNIIDLSGNTESQKLVKF